MKSDYQPQSIEDLQQEDNLSAVIVDEEEIPQDEYDELVKAMEEKRAKDE